MLSVCRASAIIWQSVDGVCRTATSETGSDKSILVVFLSPDHSRCARAGVLVAACRCKILTVAVNRSNTRISVLSKSFWIRYDVLLFSLVRSSLNSCSNRTHRPPCQRSVRALTAAMAHIITIINSPRRDDCRTRASKEWTPGPTSTSIYTERDSQHSPHPQLNEDFLLSSVT